MAGHTDTTFRGTTLKLAHTASDALELAEGVVAREQTEVAPCIYV